MLHRHRLNVFYVKFCFTIHQCLRVLKLSGLREVASEEWFWRRCLCHYSTVILQKIATHKTKKYSGSLLPYSQYPFTFPDSVPAETDRYLHTRISWNQCHYSTYTQSTDVSKATYFKHFLSCLSVPHALSFTSLHFIHLNVNNDSSKVILSSSLSFGQNN
jgi:hypothetical protein